MRRICVALAWLISVSMALAPVNAVGFGQAGAPDSGGLLANNCSDESQPLPPRPVLTRSTFSSTAPKAPKAGKPSAHAKAKVRKKTIASKPKHPNKAAAPAKPVAKAPVAKKAAPHKAAPKKPGAKKPRKVIKKRNVASKMNKKGPSAGRGSAPLERATFGSPICADRAPVMQAFGLDDATSPLGEEFAQAINDALAPQDTTFTDGNFGQNPFNSFGNPRSSTFPTVPGISGGGGGVNPGTGNNGGGDNGGGTNPGGGDNGGGTNPGGGDNGGGTNPGGGDNGGGTNPGGGDNGGNNGGGGETPAVPEPASWVMMILGFGLAGFALRRRRPSQHQQHI